MLLALIAPPAAGLEIAIEAAVAEDLRSISGTLRVSEPLELADPLALLPPAPDDRSTFRTWPGRPERGVITWEAAGEGTWRFTTTLPRRYGGLGVLPHRGLWANGAWYPQPLVGGEVPVADWVVSVELPEGYEAIRFAWVEFTLPQGVVVRPLVEFDARPQGTVGVVPGRVVYLDPAAQRALDAYTAAAQEGPVSAH